MSAWLDLLPLFVAWLARNSLQACLLVGLILGLQALLRDRLSPRWHYALWLILVAKLALPWGPPSPLSLYNLLSFASRPAPAETPATMQAETDIVAAAADSPGDAAASPSPAPVAAPAETTIAAAAPVAWREILWKGLPLAWLAGAGVLALVTAIQALRLGSVRRERFVTDQATLDLLEDCKQQMGVPAYLAVVETSRVSGPALFGFLRPRLLLPTGAVAALGRDRLRHIFLHELAHLKRYDITVNWLLAILQILHWFNPLVWYAFARMRADREVACDALALSHAGAPDPQDYGRTIVDMLETFLQPSRQPNLAGVLEDKAQLTRRITMIAQFRKSSRAWPLSAVALLVLTAGVALTNAQSAALVPNITITGTDIRVLPDENPEMGSYFVVVALRNQGGTPVQQFNVRFYRGDPLRGGKLLGLHNAGPIEPGKVWNERTGNLALREGANQFTVVLGSPDRPLADVPPQHIAGVEVTVQDGKIVSQLPAQASADSPANSANDAQLNEGQRLYAEWTGKTFPEVVGSVQYADLSEAAGKELESKWIAALRGPKNATYQGAICNLGAIKSRKAVPLLLKIATERVEKDNADRCMAVRSLGLIGDVAVVPQLIPLLYHYNQNTRFWAQISLVRLTGQNFADDWQDWAKWWNSQGKETKVPLEPVAWPCSKPEWMDRDKQREADARFIAKLKGSEARSGSAEAPPETPAAAPSGTVVLSHVATASQEKQSYGGNGFAESFERPDGPDTVIAVEIYCSRYGSPQPPAENFHIYLLDETQKVIKDVPVPYGRVNRGDMKWYVFPIPQVQVPRKFHVALDFNAEQTKGVYVGKDTSVKETHSFAGLPDKGFERVDGVYDWMIRVRLAGGGVKNTSPASPAPANGANRQALRTKFELRMRQDLQKYSREQISEAEGLYQVANKNWRSPEAKTSLEQMIAKYPDLNRTGCAVLYMAQWAQGEERKQLLQQAIDKYADCMYGDGVQVGAYARFYLAETYDAAGQKDKARALYDEIRRLYPDAVNHRGVPLAQLIEASHPTSQPSETAK